LKSVQGYFKDDPLVKFSTFNGTDFGWKVVEWLDAPTASWLPQAAASSDRVRAELDWGPLCRRAVDFAEKTVSAART
jgi:hypothetical protein